MRGLFKETKQRERKNLKYDYSIDKQRKPAVLFNGPIYAFRRPRTKEKWSDEEQSMVKEANCNSLTTSLPER
ncbi:MAG: hypothetical protein DRQ02_13460 [Candidatus Latescibacterota bacterium]|nr:MAG: hypothetical protein DRQ02_13460 [Candidatus Latescibacterota bacterium]